MRPAAALLILLFLASPSLADEPPSVPDWGFTEIDRITLGEQVTGEPLTHHDLRGRVVLLYHWGITCPISTGAFPAVNRIVAEYRDRGLVVVGFQVRRDPDVLAENVQYYLNWLQPDFPVFRLGDDWEWPAKYLPWGLLYDHEGKQIYAGSLPGIGEKIEAALAKAGHPWIGGPYVEIADLAEKIAADPDHLGAHLAEARKLAQSPTDPKRPEAQKLLERVKLRHAWLMEKAELAPGGPVQAAGIYDDLRKRFAGDPLAAEPAKRGKAITGSEGWADEQAATAALDQARSAFRHLPPAGRYAYDMTYTESTDADVLATRARMITEFRAALESIVAARPKTWAAGQARDLRFVHDAPFLEEDAAKKCLAEAKAMLHDSDTLAELYDVWLLAKQLEEGYFGEGAIATDLAALQKDLSRLAPEIAKAAPVHRACNATELDLVQQVRLAGSALLRADADRLIGKLEANAGAAGKHSRVAKRTRRFIEELERSYAGAGNLGVVFDPRWTRPGARVRYVYPRSAAERDGVKAGDVLTAIDGKAVGAAAAVDAVLEEKRPGDEVTLTVRREGTKREIPVVLGRSVR